jgi:hypothetical protein
MTLFFGICITWRSLLRGCEYELEKLSKEGTMAYLKALPQHLPEGPENNNEILIQDSRFARRDSNWGNLESE